MTKKIEYMEMKIKREIKLFKVRLLKRIKSINPNNNNRSLSKNLNESQKLSIGIFFKILKMEDTELLYDLLSSECYLTNERTNTHIFIEDRNIKVINSVYSYDIPIDYKTEGYLVSKFELELSKRRLDFKNDIISKTNHCLLQTYNKLSNINPDPCTSSCSS
jgi:hypothetical protein